MLCFGCFFLLIETMKITDSIEFSFMGRDLSLKLGEETLHQNKNQANINEAYLIIYIHRNI